MVRPTEATAGGARSGCAAGQEQEQEHLACWEDCLWSDLDVDDASESIERNSARGNAGSVLGLGAVHAWLRREAGGLS